MTSLQDIRGVKVWLTPRQAIEVIQAEGFNSVSQQTMRNWCREYGIGRKIGGRWKVNEFALRQIILNWNNEGEGESE